MIAEATRAQLLGGKLGNAKPSRAAYHVPLLVIARGKKVTVWGGVRGHSSGKVRIVNAGKVVKTVSLSKAGYFSTSLKKRKGTWQLRFGGLRSRVAKPTKV